MKKILILIPIFAIQFGFSQVEPDDIAVVTDEFEISFYESIKQKGIQNHDKAIQSLEKCLQLQPKNDVVLYELGKNYLELKKYKDSYDNFENATKLNNKNRWYFHGMYDVCYQTQDYLKAIDIVQLLIPFDAGYREDLASLYMKTQQYDKALTVINDLNATAGKSEKRELYKAQILNNPENQNAEIKNLLDLISKNPKEVANYNALMSLYTKAGKDKEAISISEKLAKENPESDWAQVEIFKEKISKNDGTNAVIAMNNALASNQIDFKIKHRILNEFLIFVKNNPSFDADLEKAVGYFKNDSSVKVAREIGKFFQNKQNWIKAIQYYELDAKTNLVDLDTGLLALECYLQANQLEALSKKASDIIELYPLQPQTYIYAGTAYNKLKNYKKAKEILELGLDYVVDNAVLEIQFHNQLTETFVGLLDNKKAEYHKNKVLVIKNK